MPGHPTAAPPHRRRPRQGAHLLEGKDLIEGASAASEQGEELVQGHPEVRVGGRVQAVGRARPEAAALRRDGLGSRAGHRQGPGHDNPEDAQRDPGAHFCPEGPAPREPPKRARRAHQGPGEPRSRQGGPRGQDKPAEPRAMDLRQAGGGAGDPAGQPEGQAPAQAPAARAQPDRQRQPQ